MEVKSLYTVYHFNQSCWLAKYNKDNTEQKIKT